MTAPAIELVDLHKNFGATQIIRGVSLAVPPGERHAIIGPNGAGKSTLFNLISGRFTPSSGTVRLNGDDITGLPPHLINRRGLARSFQVTNIFPRLSVWENIRCAVLWSLGYKYAFWRGIEALPDVRARTEAILEAIELIDRRRVQAGVLAYAEQRALEIGITIAGGAGIILLDEPSAGMSVAEAARAVALIRKVTEGRTLIMIEHDMGVVFDLADRISVLVYGQIIASDIPARIKQDAAVQTAYLGNGGMMLDVRDLHAYYGKSHILRGVSLCVGTGEIVSVLGRNGVGRSTTLKAIMGDVPPHGSITFKDEAIAGLKPFEIAQRGIGYVPEDRAIFPTLTVEQNLILGVKAGKKASRWCMGDTYELFPRLEERAKAPAGVISGGEQQMLTICRTLMGDPDLIMIDEPTEGLAPQMVERVANLLQKIAERDISILLVEQKLTIAMRISHRVYVMGHGHMVFEGTPADLAADSQVRQAWLEV